MLNLWTAFQTRISRGEEGAGMVEYALLVALIAILLVGAVVALRVGIDTSIRNSTDQLTNAT